MIWARMLAYITGTVDQELLLRNEYLAAENRILRAQIKGRLLLSDAEKATLAEIAHRLKRKALEELAAVAKPDTLLAWYRKLIANKFDGSKFRKSWGRPRVDEETERLVVQMDLRNFDPSNLLAMSFRYQASSVSGFATAANSSKAFRLSRWAISANVAFSASDNNNLPLIWALRMRFSAARYSFLSSSSWSTVPVM